MRRLNPTRLAALLVVALALFAGACSSGPTDTASPDVGDVAGADDTADAVQDARGDAEADLADDADEKETEMAEEVEEEEAAVEALGDADDADADAAEEALTAPSSGVGRAGAALDEGSMDNDGLYHEPGRADAAETDRDDGSSTDAEGLFAPPAIAPAEPEPVDPRADRLVDNRFTHYGYRQFIEADEDPLSTFALDVDTGSWTVARRWLTEGVLPPPEAVRVEEFVNWFDYDYEVPGRGLEISIDGGPSPFDNDNVLVRVGVAAEQVLDRERPPVALTFIVDTSGSMDRDDRLGLVKDSLTMLVDELDDDDTVALVIYANDSGVVLEPTRVRDRREILDAIDSLRPGGSTNLESGLREGYALAASAYRHDGINRVIIASDGVANAGIVGPAELGEFIRGYADEGIQLVTVGYGMGNFNDTMMEQLADNGDGFYAYIDTHDEAQRLFEDELTSTLVTAAIDAKIQVEFDPDIVDEYRLIGFENRGVLDREFRNDRVDAGELGAGHQVTAMYEIDLRRGVSLDDRADLGRVYLRWEDPDSHEVIEIDEDIDLRDIASDWSDAAADLQLATVVTAFAEVLRDNPYADDVRLNNVLVEVERLADRSGTAELDELADLVHIAVRLT